jgi:hypothetical protein
MRLCGCGQECSEANSGAPDEVCCSISQDEAIQPLSGLGMLRAEGPASEQIDLQGVNIMTNIKTAFGATVWAAVTGLLLLATFEPISTDAPVQVAAVAASQAAA